MSHSEHMLLLVRIDADLTLYFRIKVIEITADDAIKCRDYTALQRVPLDSCSLYAVLLVRSTC